jgi:hypothetical protein
MRSTWIGGEVRKMLTKEKIERCTLWVLAAGLLMTVTLSVAKSVVRDYMELRQEIHRPAATETQATNKVRDAISNPGR